MTVDAGGMVWVQGSLLSMGRDEAIACGFRPFEYVRRHEATGQEDRRRVWFPTQGQFDRAIKYWNHGGQLTELTSGHKWAYEAVEENDDDESIA